MALNQGNKSLRDLMATRNKGLTSQEIPKSQVPPTLPPPPPIPPTDLGLHAIPNLKKKRPVQELEEGEVVPQKGAKQQKTAKDPKEKDQFCGQSGGANWGRGAPSAPHLVSSNRGGWGRHPLERLGQGVLKKSLYPHS